MKDNAYERIMDSKAGKILVGSLVYGIMFEILLYRNMNGIGIPVLMLTTCLFLIGFFRIFEMRIKQETVFYMAAMVLLGISTVLTTSDFFLIWNWFGSICMFFLVLIHQFYDDRKWSFAQYLKIYLRMWVAPFGNLLSPFRALIREKGRKAKPGEKTSSGYVTQIFIGCAAAILLLIIILPLLFSGDTSRQKNFFCSCLDLYFALQYCKHLPIMIQICVRRSRRIDLSRCQGLPAYPF